MTFEELAKRTADTIMREDVVEESYTSYAEMQRTEQLDADDVRDMICERVKECGGDCWDDETVILNSQSIFADEMAYGQFKKLVMKLLK